VELGDRREKVQETPGLCEDVLRIRSASFGESAYLVEDTVVFAKLVATPRVVVIVVVRDPSSIIH
jgi:hypothetical protein